MLRDRSCLKWLDMVNLPQVVMAFDYGVAHTGVALGHSYGNEARRLTTIHSTTRSARWQAITDLLKIWAPTALVVGLPLTQSGEEQLATRQARHFAQSLKRRYRLPVHLIDERYSSVMAQQNMREAGRSSRLYNHEEHAEAAMIILQTFWNCCDEIPSSA